MPSLKRHQISVSGTPGGRNPGHFPGMQLATSKAGRIETEHSRATPRSASKSPPADGRPIFVVEP
jgi:hypothetical protein